MHEPDLGLLDDETRRAGLDTGQMLGLVADFPTQCERAYGLAESAALPGEIKASNILVAGMGGSAIGGDIVAAAFSAELAVPLTVCRVYRLPAHVSSDSLVICASYSGNTEETLSAFEDADRRGARIVCISSGGKLSELARARSHPVIAIPGGQPPRSATGYLLVPQIVLLQRVGLLSTQKTNLERAIQLLRAQGDRLGPGTPLESNESKQLAAKLYRRVPIIYGSTPWAGVVAYRWKTQINENAKVHAFAHSQSELSHNEILGWEGSRAQGIEAAVVNIRDRGESDKIKKRIEVTGRLIGDQASVTDVYGEGESALHKALTAAYVGDFASVYLGLLYGTDPTPIPGIDILKAELAKVSD